MKGVWYKRKDGVEIFKVGMYKVLEIEKRPHGGYCLFVYYKGIFKSGEGYFGTSLPTLLMAKIYGLKKAKELNII